MHWAQDESRCYRTVSLMVIANADEYQALLVTALDWAALRKVGSNPANTMSKVADQSKFKDERTWPEWEVIFGNYISTIPGVNVVPLLCILQYQAAPDRTTDFQRRIYRW